MKRIQKYVCGECGREHVSAIWAEQCEEGCRNRKRDIAKLQQEEKRWQDQGHDTWLEHGHICHAQRVDPDKYGPHDYGKQGGTSDCAYHCGCWMGPCTSGGSNNPFGACPNNPKK